MSTPAPLRIVVNGDSREAAPGTTIGELMDQLALPRNMVLVELNGEAQLRDQWPGIVLQEGDRLELLRVVAGG